MPSVEAMEMQELFYSLARKPRVNKNKRYKCSCGHKTTKNQLKRNGHHCHQCGASM